MTFEIFIPAFILGAVSSLHCIGMCGPLAMALPLKDKNASKFTGALLYNLGRVTTYASFGLVFGMIGRSFAWFGWQQKISISLGIIIILSLVLPRLLNKQNIITRWNGKLMATVRDRLGRPLFNGSPASLYSIGLLNGLLPCSMVYLALAGAISTGDAISGAVFMALFGAGTLPAMWAVSVFGGMMKQTVRVSARKLYPAMMMIMAMLLILRGLNLGIPYLSPKLGAGHASAVECSR
jgi:sulfite exporter TauE/SafE